MKKLLKHIIKELLQKEDFTIEEEKDGSHTNFTVKLDKDDIGMIIGKSGNTIRSIRNLVKVKATLMDKSVSVKIEEAN